MTKTCTLTAPLRVACIGAGYFSQFHLESWTRQANVTLVGVCDRNIETARTSGAPAFDDLGEMLKQTQPDLLDIILPPPSHYDTIRAALDQGISWLICQKPFCQSLDEARAVTRQAQQAGATLIVHENFRFQPWYRCLKAQLDAGALGHLQQVTFRLRPGDGQGPQAYLDRQPYFQTMPRFLIHETGVHWVDTFRFLLGDPIAIYADLRRVNPAIAGEDAGFVLFDHPGGVTALFDGNRHLDHPATNLRKTMGEALFEGTTATLHLTGDGGVHLRSFGEQTLETILPADTKAGFGGDCVHALQCHVTAGILEGTPLENTADAYLKVLEIKDAIYRSHETGQKIRL